MPERCGSFPFMNIAEDFGVPYGVTLRYAEQLAGGPRCTELDFQTVHFTLPKADRYADFKMRLYAALGVKP